jgi:predicted type IV restriction endonuclease
MEEIIFLVEDAVEGGLSAKALGVSIFTQADTYNELKEAIKDAVNCHFDDTVKRMIRLHYVKDEVFAA